jgi:hypothetical protein
MSGHGIVCLGRIRGIKHFATGSPSQRMKRNVYLIIVFFLADCREDSFVRAFFKFEALFVITEFGWLIVGFAILLFRADHCCEDVFVTLFTSLN